MMFDTLAHPASTRRVYLIFGLLIAGAWSLLFAWQNSAYAELLGHESLGGHQLPLAWHLAAFLLSWFLMTIAMMLPGSLPLLMHFIPPEWHRRQNIRVVGWIILGYLSPWVMFGLLAFLGDSFLHEMAEPGGPLEALSNVIAPAIVFTAGVYQLTPLKHRFTALCQPSKALTFSNDRHENRGAGILILGLRLGMYCVGSCWSLMLLMFALGHHRLEWMFALGVILAAERLVPWGYRVTLLVGFLLIVWAAYWVLAIS